MNKLSPRFGPLFIMAGASLWAIDALFRTQLTFTIPSAAIIFGEHLIGFIALSPIFFKNIDQVKRLTQNDWLTLLAMTIVSSVAGGILFTQALNMSFAQNDFLTPLMLLKLQPIFIVALSAWILKEKISLRFIILAIAALIGSYIMSFGLLPPVLSLQGKMLVFILAISAPICWGIGTILSKKVLTKLDFGVATSMRYLMAIPVALIFAYALGQTYDVANITFDALWRFLVIGGVTGGAAAIFIYYWGLTHTKAHVSAFAELIFPFISIIIATTQLNPYGEPQVLSVANIIGIIILIVSIVLISFETKKK